MKVELKRDEAMQLMASMNAIESAQMRAQLFVNQQNALIAAHKAKTEEVAKRIRRRVKGCPKTPLWDPLSPRPVWDLSGIDPVEFNGAVEIPEET